MSTTSGNMNTLKVTGKDGNVFVMTPVDTEARQAIDEAKNLQFDDNYFTAEVSQDQSTVSVGLNGVPIGVSSPLRFDQDTAQGIVIGIDTSAVTPAEMTGATASTDGESGIVPAPEAGDQDKYLKGDGTWANVPMAVASTSGAGGTDGLMPATDKEKLDTAKSFSAVKVTNGNVSATLTATSLNDEVELIAGDNVTLEAGLVIGGRKYRTVVMPDGNTWMAENLDFKFDGLNLSGAWDSLEPRARYYNDDEARYGVNGNKYGLLYNWTAAKYINDNNLVPGWHVPSSGEMGALLNSIDGTTASTATKLKSTTGWDSNQGSDLYGFCVYPTGFVNWNATYMSVGSYVGIWTSSEYADGQALHGVMNDGNYCAMSYSGQNTGFCVRLVKNGSANTIRVSSDVPIEKSIYGTYVSSEQGEAVQGEGGEIEVSENSVELYDTFKGVKFGAARAVADREGHVIDETYATREGATSSEAGLMSAADKSKLDGITDYVVSAEVSGSTLTLTPKTGSAVAFTASGEANVIESVKLGSDTLTPASKVVTIPMLSSTTNGAVTAPAAANRNDASFPNGTGGWSMLSEVNNSDIDNLFGVTIGGRDYRTVIIGNQMWLAENLEVTWNELIVGNSFNVLTPSAWYYNNSESTYSLDGDRKCGLMYNGYALDYIMNSLELPNGWHVPSISEWTTLANQFGGASVAGTALKMDSVSWATNWSGTNTSNLGILPGGITWESGFDGITQFVEYWASDTRGTAQNATLQLWYNETAIALDTGNYTWRRGRYIRIVKTLS